MISVWEQGYELVVPVRGTPHSKTFLSVLQTNMDIELMQMGSSDLAQP